MKIGVPGLGGPISTAGNLMFVATTQDNYLRAFDASNGRLLWEGRLPAGGHGLFGTKMGDYLVAYALPD
ncbi:PQQ-binding-like beta-propeller repeat protein [Bordetella sp. BOR01]|uniref:PQQ-binding-like beta-propeller repeat protein n=1 Tax=Bordetella sp. BOR01 TaxID=2854779 RepID=UPI00351CD054